MHTKKYIENALVELLKTKSIDKIKVNEIIDQVGSCKGTFYKYYQDKYSLLTSYYVENLYTSVEKSTASAEEFMEACLQFFQKQPMVTFNSFQSDDVNAVKAYHEKAFIKKLQQTYRVDGVDDDAHRTKTIMKLFAKNCSEVLLSWLASGAKTPRAQVLHMMACLLPRSLKKLHTLQT